jgi:two-component system response regulator YesN
MYKVLLAEDEELIRKGLTFMVDWLSMDCVVAGEAANGREGLEMIRQLQPDLVITDVRMPFLSGIEMLEQSIAQGGYEAIIVSGYEEFEYARKAISLGVTEYLLKPLDMDDLCRAIKNALEKLDARRRLRKLDTSGTAKGLLDVSGMELTSAHTKHVRIMLDYIRDNYPQKISINDVSARYGLSTSYLNTRFKEETGYTFNDFLNRYRILQALELLGSGEMKVYEVAEVVGFQDYKYFSLVFKKYVGMSPVKFLNAQG